MLKYKLKKACMQVLYREKSQKFLPMRNLILLVKNYIFKVNQLRSKLADLFIYSVSGIVSCQIVVKV